MINCRSSFSHLNLSMIFYYIILSKNSSKPHAVPDCLFLTNAAALHYRGVGEEDLDKVLND